MGSRCLPGLCGPSQPPFYDLLSRVGVERARRVVDLGCGPGHLTKYLSRRWPEAAIEAVDTSPEMVAAAEGARHRRRHRRLAGLEAQARHRRRGQQRGPALGARARRPAAPVGRRAAGRIVDRRSDPGQLRDAVACRRCGRWPAVSPTQKPCETYRFASERWSSRRYSTPTCCWTPDARSTSGRPPTCIS